MSDIAGARALAQMVEVVASSRPGPDEPGWIGFAVVAGLVLGGVILYRSLRHHLGKIDFEERPSPGSRSDQDPPADVAPSSPQPPQ